MKPKTGAVDIGSVICEELTDISSRRGQSPPVYDVSKWERACHDQRLFGICLSGGGIRSATFSLGILQGLTEKGILPLVDYLSTVSGGGYIGAWLQGLLHRCPDGYAPLTEQVPGPSRSDPITFLRKYSNYLAPRVGLSLDAVVIPVIWLRNMMLNQAIILSAMASLFLVLLLPGVGVRALADHGNEAYSWVALLLAAVAGGISVAQIGRNLRAITKREFKKSTATAFSAGQGTEKVAGWVVLPEVLAVVFLLIAVVCKGQQLGTDCGKLLGFPLLWVLLGALQWSGGFILCYRERHKRKEHQWLPQRFAAGLQLLWMSLAASIFTYFLLYEVSELLTLWSLSSAEGSQNAIAWMPPLYLMVLILGVTLQVGLMGGDFPDSSREWLARTAALLLTVAACWMFLFAIAVFSPYWVATLWLTKRAVVVSGATAWIASTVGSILAGKSAKTGGEQDQKHVSRTLDLIARYGPFIAVPSFLVALAFGTQALVRFLIGGSGGPFLSEFVDCYWQKFPFDQLSWPTSVLLLAGLSAVFAILSLRVNINEFSMHHFYKNRLVRCYLGASATKTRVADSFTGFDPKDDILLSDLICNSVRPVHAPYPIVNAALTITAGTELATQERKALPWIFTPRYSGFVPATSEADKVAFGEENINKAFVRSCEILGGGPHLGTATAISGAAVNPNMGFHSAPQTAFLLTLFNVRLGWWVGNPRDVTTYWRPGPLFALWWLLRELLGFVDARSGFLNLSDGGHFENLGLYELVRRRCRYVIAVDGEEDPDYRFGSLGGAVRKCRADFGVEIEIDPRPIQPEQGRSHSHCVVGRIHYPDKDPQTQRLPEPGWLLYVKASLSGDEPADVEEYRREQAEFPQQSTIDQFFSESQFESYRRLGLHEARTVLDHFNRDLTLDESFARLSARWELPPQAPKGASARHADAYSTLMNRLAGSTDLSVLDKEVFEDLPPDLGTNKAGREAFFFCLDLFELIESVFVDLDLASKHSWNHPGNAGWKTDIKHWAGQPSIKNVWQTQKANYGISFQHFFSDLVNEQTPSEKKSADERREADPGRCV
jgi:Patatin-like phospholipase